MATPELLWKVLTQKRWEILKAMAGGGPLSIREVARRVERDVKAVRGDVHALVNAGILDRTGDGKVNFPYDAIHVDFTLGRLDRRVPRRQLGRRMTQIKAFPGPIALQVNGMIRFSSDFKSARRRVLSTGAVGTRSAVAKES